MRTTFSALLASICIALCPELEAAQIDTESLFASASPSILLLQVKNVHSEDSIGTGFVITGGFIVTNHHVIEDAKWVVAKNQDGTLLPLMEVVADDEYRDIAVLETHAHRLAPLNVGDSDDIHVGSSIAVIGNPEGFENTIAEGIVSGIRNLDPYNTVLQISAPISKGSSGSPIFNAQQEVVGMVSSLYQDGQLINFAIPSNQIVDLLSRAKYLKQNARKLLLPDDYLKGVRNEAIAGKPDSQYFMGLTYARSKEYEEARKWFEKSALQNYNPAEEMLGYLYLNGAGVPKNKATAQYWFTRSIKHGNTQLEKGVEQ